jgi:integrase
MRKADTNQQALDLRDPGQPPLGKVLAWFTMEYLQGEQYGLSTRRGYKSTFKKAVAFFGKDARPTLGQAKAWLRPLLLGEGGKLQARAVNSHRDRLHAVYVKYRNEVLGVTLNPWAFPRFKEDTRHLKTDFADMATTWPKLLAAMPDDRARLFLTMAMRRGWRLGELVGVEWNHVMRQVVPGAKGGPQQTAWVVRKEQQRKLWKDVPQGLKHGGLVGTFKLHPEMVQLLYSVRRSLEQGEVLFGCARGALVGDKPGKDGAVRSFLFPYREEHVAELSRRLREAAPEEFPKKQAWHRLRRAYAKHVASTQGMEAANRLLGHAWFTSTQVYCKEVVGVSATGQDIAALDASMDNMLSGGPHEADNTFQGAEQ